MATGHRIIAHCRSSSAFTIGAMPFSNSLSDDQWSCTLCSVELSKRLTTSSTLESHVRFGGLASFKLVACSVSPEISGAKELQLYLALTLP